MKIGLSTKNNSGCMSPQVKLIEKGYDCIELNLRFAPIKFYSKIGVEKRLKVQKNKTIFIHSRVTDFFNSDIEIHNNQKNTIISEIKYANIYGIKYITFHLNFDNFKIHNLDNNKTEIFKLLDELNSHAKTNNTYLCLENDSTGPMAIPQNIKSIIDKYENIIHTLDIGHLNIAIHKGFTKSFKEHFDLLGQDIYYMHLHNNFGDNDQHFSLIKGNIDLDEVVRYIKKSSTKALILETRTFEDAESSLKLLKEKYGLVNE